jgi:hypothetical protein
MSNFTLMMSVFGISVLLNIVLTIILCLQGQRYERLEALWIEAEKERYPMAASRHLYMGIAGAKISGGEQVTLDSNGKVYPYDQEKITRGSQIQLAISAMTIEPGQYVLLGHDGYLRPLDESESKNSAEKAKEEDEQALKERYLSGSWPLPKNESEDEDESEDSDHIAADNDLFQP